MFFIYKAPPEKEVLLVKVLLFNSMYLESNAYMQPVC